MALAVAKPDVLVLLQDISVVSWTGLWGLEAAEYISHHVTLMIGPHMQQF